MDISIVPFPTYKHVLKMGWLFPLDNKIYAGKTCPKNNPKKKNMK